MLICKPDCDFREFLANKTGAQLTDLAKLVIPALNLDVRIFKNISNSIA